MKIAAVQIAPVFLESQATTDKVLLHLRRAAADGAELIAFPEVCLSGYPSWLRVPSVATNDDLLKIGHVAYLKSAIQVDGPELTAVCDEANRLGVFVYLGFLEKGASGGSVYASLAAINPDRGVVGVHRKLKPTFHERLAWSDGDGAGLLTHQWGNWTVGGLNCYENWLPLARQALYEQGEQLHVATWPGDLDVTENISQFVAMEGRVYVMSVSGLLRAQDIPNSFPLRQQLVEGRGVINNGGSMIVAPGGTIIAGPVTDEECVLTADIDLDMVMAEHLKLDPAGHYSRHDVLTLSVNRQRHDAKDNPEQLDTSED